MSIADLTEIVKNMYGNSNNRTHEQRMRLLTGAKILNANGDLLFLKNKKLTVVKKTSLNLKK
jgi:hypothetical protein